MAQFYPVIQVFLPGQELKTCVARNTVDEIPQYDFCLADKPTFPELWEKIQPLMDSGLLIAHNAPFDMGVLAQCLSDYHIGELTTNLTEDFKQTYQGFEQTFY